MWTPERHDRIISLLQQRQRLTTDAFALELGVSKETVRRDLIELESNGKLKRMHGGAVPCVQPVETLAEASYLERGRLHQAEKRAIARTAAALIEAGSTCFIDAGSSTNALAQAMLGSKGIRVITNSVEVARTLASSTAIEVHLLGGQLQTDVPATSGEFTVSEIARFHADYAVISPTALNPEHGALNYAWHEASVARAMLAHARHSIMLANAHKLGQGSRVQICTAASIDSLVTDHQAEPAMLERLRKSGIKRVISAGA
ncbi:DeoR/GlpR family DNA-binding transcription regulator [Roseateles oligotrophus]|uniref:DeoR/GlpR family DNA-binding transcription regulator n=1 Tax=Roseateles oligotrophus TaxID=1769250 RepID=A0ABT2YHH7_9BURK|nr:DeoR/GlpR family DNA-binding transcription regulator [Roseateles oligotrophus]MCV2369504.1 DeoR/GlpR family DNA-binding transcription regulator [Roseateles oligotrophus]